MMPSTSFPTGSTARVLLYSILISSSLISPNLRAETIIIDPKFVIKKALEQSPKAKEIAQSAEIAKLPLVEVYRLYDFTLTAEAGHDNSQYESSTISALDRTEVFSAALGVKKPFSTGTTLGLDLTRANSKYWYVPTATGQTGRDTKDIWTFSIEQNLWNNFFGKSQRSTLEAAEKQLLLSRVNQDLDLSSLALESTRSFWNAFVSEQTYLQSLASKERYQKLVDVAEKKNKYGYTTPGELPLLKAEFIARDQALQAALSDKKTSEDQLKTILGLPLSSEIRINVSAEVTSLQKAEVKNIESLKSLQAADLRIQTAQAQKRAFEAQSSADLSLVGRASTQGYDESPEVSLNEQYTVLHPRVYVGLKFSYAFGSDYQNEKLKYFQAQTSLAEIQRQRLIDEKKSQQEELIRRMAISSDLAKTSLTQKDLRKQAVVELQKSYNQGRTDISVLIDAINKQDASEFQFIKALSQFNLALAEWDAFQDQLISY